MQVGEYAWSLEEMSEIMSQSIGWEKTISVNLKLENGNVVIGNDKLPSVVSIKLRIIGGASISSSNSPGSSLPASLPASNSLLASSKLRRRIGYIDHLVSFLVEWT